MSWIDKQLRGKTQRGERYTLQDAVQSLLLDRLRDIDRDKSSYARIWDWGRSTIYDHWDEISSRAEQQRTFYTGKRDRERSCGKVSNPTDTRTPSEHSLEKSPDKNRPSESAETENPTPARRSSGHSPDTDPTPYIPESLDTREQEFKSNNNNNPQRLDQGKPPPEENVVVGLKKKVVQALRRRGIARPAALQLAQQHEPRAIQLQVHHLEWLKGRGQPPDDEAAWLVAAIRESYGLPPGLQRQLSQQQIPSRKHSGDGQAAPRKAAGDGQAALLPELCVNAAPPPAANDRSSAKPPPDIASEATGRSSGIASTETADTAAAAAIAACGAGMARKQRQAELRRRLRREQHRLEGFVSHLRRWKRLEPMPRAGPPPPVYFTPERYDLLLKEATGDADRRRSGSSPSEAITPRAALQPA